MDQLTIFNELYPTFKITKPIRLIEFFGGYGSQALALKYLGANFEHWKLCEWAIKSIQAYKDIHFTNDNTNYSKDLSKEDLVSILFFMGISSNYNEPMTLDQINRLSETQLRTIYNNIEATHNLVNVQQVKGKDLEITDKDKYDYIMTYSFPCQDLSLAGKGKGMSDTTTRSGMLWEVERILTECQELDQLPQILVMENVPQVHSVDNVSDFNKWKSRLEEMGYKNYFEDLIATDYGIPQTRNRCFMISLLGDYSYSFPPKQKLKLKLKDLLEDNVDEKYYCRMEHHRGTVQKGKTQTLTTMGGENNGVVVKDDTPRVLGGIGEKKSNDGTQWYQQDRIYDDNVSIAITTSANPYYKNDLRIRKLTPKECFRLMGVKDEDFEKCAKNQSDSSLYHLAGDSIVVNVLIAIFSQMI